MSEALLKAQQRVCDAAEEWHAFEGEGDTVDKLCKAVVNLMCVKIKEAEIKEAETTKE